MVNSMFLIGFYEKILPKVSKEYVSLNYEIVFSKSRDEIHESLPAFFSRLLANFIEI